MIVAAAAIYAGGALLYQIKTDHDKVSSHDVLATKSRIEDSALPPPVVHWCGAGWWDEPLPRWQLLQFEMDENNLNMGQNDENNNECGGTTRGDDAQSAVGTN